MARNFARKVIDVGLRGSNLRNHKDAVPRVSRTTVSPQFAGNWGPPGPGSPRTGLRSWGGGPLFWDLGMHELNFTLSAHPAVKGRTTSANSCRSQSGISHPASASARRPR
jgi:hypothetical protein